MKTIIAATLIAAGAFAAAAALAQPASPPRLQVEKPNYVSIPMEIAINKPAAAVWARIGKFCDIGEWFQIPAGCQIIAGKDGQFGAQRSVAREVLVGMTPLSYTYTQPV